MSREERGLAEERFYHGTDACIVCTSTLELGIDVGDLDRVLQAEAPETVSSFLQRMGRTGRRDGQTANTTFFCETSEAVLQAIALVELARSGWVESSAVDGRCWPVLIHQILAMSLAEDGVTAEAAWAHLSRVPDFREVRRDEFDRLVDWMLRDGGIRLASGTLVLGPKAERKFGRKNFMELFAVFSSPQSYTVQTGSGHPLGSLNQAFVDRLVEDVSTFLPQFLGYDICQRVLQVLREEAPVPYLDVAAALVLAEQRETLRAVLAPDHDGIEIADDELRWWTFAGGRINATLQYALEAAGSGWTVIPDNYCLKVRGDGLDVLGLRQAIAHLKDASFWEDDKLWAGVTASLPSYRLSKFQPLMPPWVEREVIATYLLDVPGAWRWLQRSHVGLGQSSGQVE